METLKTYLDNNGLTYQAFGKLIGVGESTVCRYLRGQRMPSRETMFRIQRATQGDVPASCWDIGE